MEGSCQNELNESFICIISLSLILKCIDLMKVQVILSYMHPMAPATSISENLLSNIPLNYVMMLCQHLLCSFE